MTTDLLSSGNNEGGINPNLASSGPLLQGSLPMPTGLPFETGSSGAMSGFQTTTQQFSTTSGGVGLPMGGTVMGVGGGVGDEAQDVTYSTKNNQQFAFGAGATQLLNNLVMEQLL